MKTVGTLMLSMIAAALTPLLASERAHSESGAPLEWPHEFRGRPLMRVEFNDDARRFLANFPGSVARFTDGEYDIIMRWVHEPTRRLHPAEDCYRGWGYEVAQSRIHNDGDGTRWRCFKAKLGAQEREVCEQMRDLEGQHFTDVSAWYWSATLHETDGPWLVTTISR